MMLPLHVDGAKVIGVLWRWQAGFIDPCLLRVLWRCVALVGTLGIAMCLLGLFLVSCLGIGKLVMN